MENYEKKSSIWADQNTHLHSAQGRCVHLFLAFLQEANRKQVLDSQSLPQLYVGVSIRVNVSGSCRVEVGIFD